MKAKKLLIGVGFILIATATAWAQPDIKVRADDTELVAGSGSFDLGTVIVGYPATYFLLIENTGNSDLILDAMNPIAFCCTDPPVFSSSGSYASQVIPPAGILAVDITVLATSTGALGTIVGFGSNDPDEGTYVISLSAQAEALPGNCEVVTGGMEKTFNGSIVQGLIATTGVSSYTVPAGWTPGVFGILAAVFGSGEANVRTTADARTGAQGLEVFSAGTFAGDAMTSVECEAGTATLRGYYKFAGASTDIGMIAVSSGGGIEANRTETNSDTLLIAADASTYTLFEIVVPYDANSVDSVLVWFAVSANADGASLKIDDLELITTPAAAAAPDKPAPVTFTSPTTTSVTVNWVEPDDNLSAITAYTLEQKEGSGGSFAGIYTGSNLSFAVSGLTPETSYFYRVKATNAEGDSDFSNEAEYVTAAQIIMANGSVVTCNAPFLDPGGAGPYSNNVNMTLTVSPATPGQRVKVSFTTFGLENGFDKLYVYDGPSAVAEDLIATLTGASIPSDITASESGGDLTFKFTSDGSATSTGWEATLTCVAPPPAAAPDKPSLVTFSAQQNVAVRVHWAEPDDNGSAITSYTLQQKEGAGAYGTIYTGTSLFFDAIGLTPGASYFYQVKATNVEGDSDYSDEVEYFTGTSILMQTADLGTCDATFRDSGGDANYTNGENRTLIVHPENVGGKVTITFISFELENTFDKLYVYNGQSTDPGDLLATLTGSSLPGPITSTAPDGELTFNFVADGSDDMAGWVATLTCSGAQSPDKPSAPTFGEITTTSIVVNWAAPDDNGAAITGYLLEQEVDNSGVLVEVFNGNQLTFTASGLLPSTEYSYRVSAINANGSSVFSDESTVMTDEGVAILMANGSIETCGAVFFDSGGSGSYGDNEDLTITLTPATQGQRIHISITSFKSEQTLDKLTIYEGPEATGPYVVLLSGTSLGFPYDYTSEAPSGELTFTFESDGSITNDGWQATVTCVPPPPPDKPSMILSNPTATSVSFSWYSLDDNGSPITSYTLQQKAGAGGVYGDIYVGGNTYFQQQGLTPGTTYYFRVKATNEGSDSDYSDEIEYLAATYLYMNAGPAAITCDAIFVDGGGALGNYPSNRNETVTVSPENVGGKVSVTFSSFNLSNGDDFLYIYNGPTIAPEFLLATLTSITLPGTFTSTSPNGELTFRFTSSPTIVSHGWVATLSCSGSQSPDKPAAPSFGEITASSIVVNWTAPDDNGDAITAYALEQSDNGPDNFQEVFNGDQLTYTATGLQPVSEHTFRVRAINGNGSSVFSVASAATTEPDVPDQPEPVILTSPVGTSVTVNWQEPENNGSAITAYTLEQKEGAGAFTEIYTGADLSFTINDLSAATSYFFRIKATNSVGDSDFCDPVEYQPYTQLHMSDGSFETCGISFFDSGGLGPYGDNEDFTVTMAPSTPGQKIKVTFSSFHTDYSDLLYIYEGQGTTNLIFYANGASVPPDITSDAPGGELTFRFISNASATTDGWEASITCVPASPPDKPLVTALTPHGAFSIMPSSATGVNVYWNLADGHGYPITSATLQQKEGAGGVYNDVYVGLAGQFSATGLTPGVTYYFRVKATSAVGDSDFSDEVEYLAARYLYMWYVTDDNSQYTATTCDAIFVDGRGTVGSYGWGNGSTAGTHIMTVVPENEGGKVSVTFSSFDLQDDSYGSDVLYVYDGPTIAPQFLLATLTGTSLPQSLTSTAADGELTFKFIANYNDFGNAGWVATLSCSGAQAPDKPAVPTFGEITTHSITVNWIAPDDNGDAITTYSLEQSSYANPGFHEIFNGNQLTFTDTGLLPNFAHQYRVRAINANGSSTFSEVASANTLTLPNQPSTLTFETITSTSIVVNWAVPFDNGAVITGYVLEQKTFDVDTYEEIFNGNALTFTATGLEPVTAYQFRVAAIGLYGQSDFTYSHTTTDSDVPDQPAPTNFGAISTTSIVVTWQQTGNNGAGVDSYTLEQKEGSGGSFSEIFVGNAVNYTSTGLSPNTTYYFRVLATNAKGNSPFSSEASATTDALGVPEAPNAPNISTVGSNSIALNWQAPIDNGESIDSYTVEQKEGPGGSFTEIFVGNSQGIIATGLDAATTYYFRVKATNAFGDSPFSAESNATTLPSVPDPPAAPTLSAITATSMVISWPEPDGNGSAVTFYTVQMQTNMVGEFNTVAGTAFLTQTISTLSPGMIYSFRVIATNSSGDSMPSEPTTATTNSTAPGKPPVPVISTVNVSSITVAWSDGPSNGSPITIGSLEQKGAGDANFSIVYEGSDYAFTSTGLTPNTQYAFRVRMANSNGYSAYSDDVVATTNSATVPGMPEAPNVNSVTTTVVSLSWPVPTSDLPILGYDVERKSGSSGVFSIIGSIVVNTFTNIGLTHATEYYYRVRAVNALGASPYSNAVVVTTLKLDQSISFASIPNKTFGDGQFAITATASSGLPVTLTTSGPITLTGNTVTIIGAGPASITATQAGNNEYLPASQVTNDFVIGKASNTITFTQADVPFSPGLVIDLSAVASSGLPLNYSITSGAGSYTVSGHTLTILAADAFTVTVSQTGNQNYLAAEAVTVMFCVNPPKPSISMLDANPESPILLSSSMGVQWYLNGSPIDGARANTHIVTEDGTYQVAIIIGACSSPLSDGFDIIITSTGVQSKTEITLYPNPAHDVIVLKGLSTQIRDVGIVGADGRHRVSRCKQSGGETLVDVTDLSVGIYLMRVADHDEVKWIRFMKE